MTATAEQLYEDIMTYIDDARQIASRGEYMTLSKLDERVARLCAAVQELPVGEASHFTTKLEEMIQELNRLQELFAQKREGLVDDLSVVGKHKQAAMAYKQQEATAARDIAAAPESTDNE